MQNNAKEVSAGDQGATAASEDQGGKQQQQDQQQTSSYGPGTITNHPMSSSSTSSKTGHLIQVTAPTRLRPFGRSVFHVRDSNELRVACLASNGHPAPIINWYIGNRLIDEEYLRQNWDEIQILQLTSRPVLAGGIQTTTNTYRIGPPIQQATKMEQLLILGSYRRANGTSSSANEEEGAGGGGELQIIEINPIQLTDPQTSDSQDSSSSSSSASAQLNNGPSNWINYRKFSDERMSIENREQQMSYLRMKLDQLSGNNYNPFSLDTIPKQNNNNHHHQSPMMVSVLVISSLDIERHSSRIACRATTRVNTDEVTTVIKVQSKYPGSSQRETAHELCETCDSIERSHHESAEWNMFQMAALAFQLEQFGHERRV